MDSIDYLHDCERKFFTAQFHAHYVGIVIALEPLHLPVYVLMWILDKLLEFAYKREMLKVRIIECVYASCERQRAKIK